MSRKKLIVGNWKMNGLSAQIAEIRGIDEIAAQYPAVEVGICTPATLIHAAHDAARSIFIGAQDCHMADSGAHTGCLSAAMVKEAGASVTIVGHSERRADQHESSKDVADKAVAARRNGLKAIICVGETEAERDAGHAEALVSAQLLDSLPEGAAAEWLSIAYEPVWAIGTGRTPTLAEVESMHKALRDALRSRIVGGASLTAEKFAPIIQAASTAG